MKMQRMNSMQQTNKAGMRIQFTMERQSNQYMNTTQIQIDLFGT